MNGLFHKIQHGQKAVQTGNITINGGTNTYSDQDKARYRKNSCGFFLEGIKLL